MSYQVLARKWRPRTFQDMVGQEYILRMLSNALQQNRIHHAYLFTGTRGVGKTTIARIFAKALNCEQAITANPCGTCAPCRAIDAGQFLDLFEVDAASRTKVEDTRELLENVLYPPTSGRFKIYLIDEVHMLSNHSFNALLKTLEEPPAHVKFLLATTDPKKLPITILSRCLQFHLKRITPQQIAKHLQNICQTENIINELPALEKLANVADGSMRDALSLLDQAIAYGNGEVKEDDVQTMLGSIAAEDLIPLLQALAQQNGPQLFAEIRALAERAPDFQQLLETLLTIFHELAINQIVPDQQSQSAICAALNDRFTAEDIQLYYQMALLGRRDLAFHPVAQQGFEMVMLRMLAFKPGIQEKQMDTPSKPPIVMTQPLAEVAVEPILQEAIKEAVHEVVIENETTPNAATDLPDWRAILPKLELTGMAYALASNCSLVKMDNSKVELALSALHQPMLNDRLKERIAESLTRHFKQAITVQITPTTNDIFTPVKQDDEENKVRLAEAKTQIMGDPKIKKLIEMYDATVEISLG